MYGGDSPRLPRHSISRARPRRRAEPPRSLARARLVWSTSASAALWLFACPHSRGRPRPQPLAGSAASASTARKTCPTPGQAPRSSSPPTILHGLSNRLPPIILRPRLPSRVHSPAPQLLSYMLSPPSALGPLRPGIGRNRWVLARSRPLPTNAILHAGPCVGSSRPTLLSSPRGSGGDSG
jgi:hypothetical protein